MYSHDRHELFVGPQKTIFLPSRVHVTATSDSLFHESCFASPPDAGTTNKLYGPVRLLVKAIIPPSGENTGYTSRPGLSVMRRSSEPSSRTLQMSPKHENAITPSQMLG